MELTAEEKKLVEPYLAMSATEGKGWLVTLALGGLLCIAAVVIRVTDVWHDARPYFLLILVAGMVLIDLALQHRKNTLLARMFQKYEKALHGESPPPAEDDEETR